MTVSCQVVGRKCNMKQEDLSLVYALKEYARVNGKGGPIIEYNRCFTLDDIKAAFNAGRGGEFA